MNVCKTCGGPADAQVGDDWYCHDGPDPTHYMLASYGDQWWFWTDEWQAGEREADADIAAGRGITFKSGAEAVAWLRNV